MKLTILALALSTATILGTTIQVHTGGATGADILDNSGAAISGQGFAAIGTFDGSVLTSNVSTAADLVSAFSLGAYTGGTGPQVALEHFGPTFFQEADGFNINNILKSSAGADLATNIAVLVWKGGADLATATEAIVYVFDAQYDTSATPTSLRLDTAPGTLAFGQSNLQMAQLGVIPEPSSMLLLGLGGLGLLGRRKR